MDLNLTTIALGLFIVIAGFVLLRGALRILLGTLVLSSSAWVGFRLWQMAPTLGSQWFGQPAEWMSIALPIAGFLITFIVGRLILKFLTSPFQKANGGERKSLTLTRLLGASIFTLIPTALISAVAAIIINHAGSIEEIKTAGGTTPQGPNHELIQTLRASITKLVPPEWLKLLDPLSDPSRIALAKLIASKSPPKPVIDPATGKEIPRAIIVDEPQLNSLAKDGRYASLLRSPLLTEALKNPRVQNAMKKLSH